MNSPGNPVSKLPDVGTTIFTVMSALAAERDALNLSQGFPDLTGLKPFLSGSTPTCAVARINIRRWQGGGIASGHRQKVDDLTV